MSSESKTILVTGGAGFIGSNYCRYVLEQRPDYRVVVLDALTYAGNLSTIADMQNDPATAPRFRFYPGKIQDETVVNGILQAEKVDYIVNFAAESVVANTFIPVHYGHGIKITSIAELFNTYASKETVHVNENGVEIIEVHLPLHALAFRNGMGQWKQITHITRHQYSGKVVTLQQKWGSVTVTPNHSIYDAYGCLVPAETNPEMLAIRKINVDKSRYRDFIELHLPEIKSVDGRLYYKGGKTPHPVFVHQRICGEDLLALMRFLGAYAAEGCAFFNKSCGQWRVTISNQNLHYLKRIQEDVARFSNASNTITHRECPNAHELVFSSKIIYHLVTTLCGASSGGKQVPDALYTLHDQYKYAFLQTYLEGDGDTVFYKTSKTHRAATTSPKLAAGLGLLYSLLGQDYSIEHRDFTECDRWNPAYTFKTVSIYDPRLKKEFTENDYNGFVYDLTVEDAHNFAAGIGNIVVHNSHNDRSILDPGSFIQTDVYGVFTLLDATKRHHVDKFLHISTDEVYGTIDEGQFTEQSPLEPNTPYSASKAGGEMQVRAHRVTYGTPTLLTRCGNNFGPYQYPEKLIPFFVTRLIDDKKVPLYGTGQQVRDWVYVMDHCSGIDYVLHHGVLGEAYNIGTEGECPNIAITHRLLQLLGKPESLIKTIPDPRGGAHDKRYSVDASKLRALGWKPAYDFDTALEQTVRWYVENEEWWREIVAQPDYQAFVQRFYGKYLGEDL